MPKRHRDEDAEVHDPTPRKTRTSAQKDVAAAPSPLKVTETPSKRKSILRGTPTKVNGTASVEPTPKSLRKVLFTTPAKTEEEGASGANQETPTAARNDRSARRKSQRTLQKQIAGNDDSDEEEDEQDEAVAAAILGEDASVDEDEEIELAEPSSAPDTPSKSGKLRGRPKGKRRERTPSPPPDLPPHELYFFQNRAGANKTSANTLPSRMLLNHEDFFAQINAYKDPHEDDIERLKQYHKRAFDQWLFEFEEGFNTCLYGYGSKRQMVMEFTEHLYVHAAEGKRPKIVVVNGYAPGMTVRDILSTLGSVVLPKGAKLPAQPAAMLDLVLESLDEQPPARPITLIIHSLDHQNLRKPATQSIVARLASHPSISLLATCDTPNFPLLWDVTLTRQLHFLYHDATTFQSYKAELDVVEEVNALLGRSARRLGGKDGVAYVLKSLPENARNLFRILIAEQLALADVEPDATPGATHDEDDLDPDDILGAEDEEEAASEQQTPSRRGRGRTPKKAKAKLPPKPVVSAPEGVEYRTLYHKAVEEFVCSSELNFRTLLKEFHDHQMIESRKGLDGTERLVVPFRREELEGVLEELV